MATLTAAVPVKVKPSWLVGPVFDLFFISNLHWPLFVLALMYFKDFSSQFTMHFYVYFILLMPHRWITLSLVFLDKKHIVERPLTYLGTGLLVLLFYLSIWKITGNLSLAVFVRFLWNGWHSASQHHGIFRLYSKEASREPLPSDETGKYLLRFFLLYIILRMGGAGAFVEDEIFLKNFKHFLLVPWNQLDYFVCLLPLIFGIRQLGKFRGPYFARTIYFFSVISNFMAMLACVHWNLIHLTPLVAISNSLMHSTEYLSIISWSVAKQYHPSRGFLYRYFVPRWTLSLGVFIFSLSICSWFMENNYQMIWLAISIPVSFLHYAYDGLIWRSPLPRKKTVLTSLSSEHAR